MTIRDLACLARLPNLPTVWSNVGTGYLVALFAGQAALRGTAVMPVFSALLLLWLLCSATMFYLCGTFLNDAIDADFDARHRGERPIPAGRIHRDVVLNLGFVFGIMGLAMAIPAGKHALVVATCLLGWILLYTWLHKRTALASLFMAMCRASLPIFGAAAVITRWGAAWHGAAWHAGTAAVLLFAYTLGISLLARGEATGGTTTTVKRLGIALLSLPFFAPLLGLAWCVDDLASALHAGLATSAGMAAVWFAVARGNQSTAAMVGSALAGLALVDLVVLSPVSPAQPCVLLLPLGAFALALLCRRFAAPT